MKKNLMHLRARFLNIILNRIMDLSYTKSSSHVTRARMPYEALLKGD